MKIQWVLSGKFSGCAQRVWSEMYPIQCNDYYNRPSCWVKWSHGPLFPRLMYHLVPILSSVLFVITEAFHIFYSDQIELVSVFPILIKLNRFSYSIRINMNESETENHFHWFVRWRRANIFSIITVLTRAHWSALRAIDAAFAHSSALIVINRGFCGLAFSRSLRASPFRAVCAQL